MDARTILATLTNGAMPRTDLMSDVGDGISHATRTTLRNPFDGGDAVECIVKHEPWRYAAAAEALAYTVSTLSPGLVDVPETVCRLDAMGHTVSVQAWRRDGRTDAGTLDTVLRSDIVGLAAFDWIIANGDRHGHNVLYVPTGHYHHDRLIAIDHGAAFAGRATDPRYAVGRMSGLRVPHYIHEHAERIVAGAAILRDAAEALGHADWADATIRRAQEWTRMATYPVAAAPRWAW